MTEKPTKSRAAKYTEAVHQACVIRGLRAIEDVGYPIASAGDQNAAKRGPKAMGEAKMTGLTPGEHDVRVYLDGGRLVLIELKNERGRLSEDQKKRHERLEDLGHKSYVVEGHEEPLDTALEVGRILADELGFRGITFDEYMKKATNEILAAMATGVAR